MIKIILVRHGRTDANDKNIGQGWGDGKLNKEGLRQARLIANSLKNEKIDLAFSSDLSRAKKTAEKIMKFHDADLILDKRLREQNKGIYEGSGNDKMEKDIKERGIMYEEFIPEDGESMLMVGDRVINFLNELEKMHKDKSILVVSHGGPLLMLGRHIHNDWAGNSWKKYNHDNTGASYLEYKNGKWKFTRINCTEHLK